MWTIIIVIIGRIFSFKREVTVVVVLLVFDCLPHSFLIAKLDAYGFDKTSTEYLKDYETFSSWTNILHEVPQGSILVH